MKALKILLDKDKISRDVVLMADEMYLQKVVQYNSGEYVGADEDGSLYKDVVVLMEQGLQKSSVFVIVAADHYYVTATCTYKVPPLPFFSCYSIQLFKCIRPIGQACISQLSFLQVK